MENLNQTGFARHNLGINDPYLNLKRADAETRFQFQRRTAHQIKNAETQQNSFLLADLKESRTDYGMTLDSSKIHFHTWIKRPEFSFSSYQTQEDTVFYRGLEFKTGDILLCNRARGSDGMFTTLLDGRQSFAHVALYALLENDGELFPSVIEIHYQGVRAIPLKVYLSQAFSTYIEVYRSYSVLRQSYEKIASVSKEMLSEQHGFDIYLDETQDTYLTCAQTAAKIYQRCDLHLIRGTSTYHTETMANLEKLDVVSCANRHLLMPDDYSKNENFEMVGVLDNGNFIELVARALVREQMQHLWQTAVLDPSQYSIHFSVNHFVARIASKRIPVVSSFAAWLGGFSRTSFPSGPANFIALVPIVEPRIEKAAAQLSYELKKNADELPEFPKWENLMQDSLIRKLVIEAMSDFQKLFNWPTSYRSI